MRKSILIHLDTDFPNENLAVIAENTFSQLGYGFTVNVKELVR